MRTRSRRLILVFVALAATVVPLLAPTPSTAAQSDADIVKWTCALPHSYLLRTLRGWSPDRGAEITMIPQEPDFVGSGLPHVGPWDYIQHVPMWWYGPGYIKAQKPVARPVTLADIAPTQSDLLNFNGFTAIDGRPMTEALAQDPKAAGYTPPKLVVVMVWDAGGINVLQAHPKDWPYLRSMLPQGTFYENAFVGSSPTSTAQDHATIGTGAFPIHHGLVGHHFQINGQDTTPWELGPNFFMLPTFADVYDLAMGNKPTVGAVGTADIHLGMLGHGSFWQGGDRDIAITRSAAKKSTLTDEGNQWNLPPDLTPYYRLAGYANGVPGFALDKTKLDRRDGKLDGNWRDNNIADLLNGFDTPARTPYEERVVQTVLQREHFGKDATPDLFYVNFKEIDYISHVWSMNSPEMSDAVKYQDDALKQFIGFLNQDVGKGNYVMVLTADHAAMPNPAVSGGYQISAGAIQQQLEAQFDLNGPSIPVVNNVQPSNIFINTQELTANGFTLDDVARFMQGMTQADTAGGGVVPQPGHENDPVFAAVFPSAIMENLPCLPEAAKVMQNAI
ncbi:MAG: alkaline phosphatase family protein [Actinomycetota bacterium]